MRFVSYYLQPNVVLTGPVRTRIARPYWVRWSNWFEDLLLFVWCHPNVSEEGGAVLVLAAQDNVPIEEGRDFPLPIL